MLFDLPQRFKDKIEVVTESGCWIWTGACQSASYAVAYYKGNARRVHRIIYGLLVGPIPQGLEIDHLCKVRCCVNPYHLEPVTHLENLRRGETIGVKNRRKTHCSKNHAFVPDNIYTDPKNRRRCRMCNRLNTRQNKRNKTKSRI
jgi:hypothetical protein